MACALDECSYYPGGVSDSAGAVVSMFPAVLADTGEAPAGSYTWSLFARDRAGNKAAGYPVTRSLEVAR
jgi:hypothetical protein